MTLYLDISRELAGRVVAGELEPGAELPSIRRLAEQRHTTASTVSRSYRHLAQTGVIAQSDRRRARIAPYAQLAARRLLGTERDFRLAGSDDPALDVVLRETGRAVIVVGTRGSFQGLAALWRGTADGAAIHLLHHSGVYNAPYAAALLRGRQPSLIHLWRREQGLLVPPGNPREITGARDLRRARVAKREFGAGTRVLLDRVLQDANIAPESVPGPETTSHLEVALAVASGVVDVGLGVRAAATALELDFIPLVWEEYDIALPGDALGAAQPLVTALRTPAVRRSITQLGGYDTARAGEITALADSAASGDVRAGQPKVPRAPTKRGGRARRPVQK
ncbi:MAG TPA: substrate-binding domain-containing protein [Solirubrobacteraceae bacterium]|nr:substrate-binding domain-containing protein [Solirubrobacteraceae bacterium]